MRDTTSHALCFGGSDIVPHIYFYAYMDGDEENMRSTIGYVFTVGGTTISCILKLQKVVALSTTKVEYVATLKASKDMI